MLRKRSWSGSPIALVAVAVVLALLGAVPQMGTAVLAQGEPIELRV